MRPLASSTLTLALLLLSVILFAPAASAQEQVHLSVVDDRYVVTFASPTPLQSPTVAWQGPSSSGVVNARLQDRPPVESVLVYNARLPSSATSYTVGGRTFEIATLPAANESLRIAFVADHGTTEKARTITTMMGASGANLILHGGDIAYADGDHAVWDHWFNLHEDVMARIPWMPAIGNHEMLCATWGIGDVPKRCPNAPLTYNHRFSVPNEPHLYYQFTWGPLNIISFNAEAYYAEPAGFETDKPAQLAFLVDALARGGPDRWNIVFTHQAPYSSNGGHGSNLALRADLEPVLDAHGADLLLAGHDHHYERSWPLRAGVVQTQDANITRGDGVVYVVSGGGGKSLYTRFEDPQPEWSAYREAGYQFLLIDASTDRLDVQSVAINGTVMDRFSITRAANTSEGGASPAASGAGVAFSFEAPAPAGFLALLLVLVCGLMARRLRGAR